MKIGIITRTHNSYLWKCALQMMWSLWKLHSQRLLGPGSALRMGA